jgi:hypothetical protein
VTGRAGNAALSDTAVLGIVSRVIHSGGEFVHPRPSPAPPRRSIPATANAVLSLQAAAGNHAVTSALREIKRDLRSPLSAAPAPAQAALIAQRQQVQPKAPTKLSGKAGAFQTFIDGGGPYVFSMYVLNDDIIGHAWVGVRRGDGQSKTAGFWPGSLWSGIVGPGLLMTPDGHEGGQSGATGEPISDIKQMYRLLSVIQDWDGAYYSLLFKNCAHFVVDAWKTVTGKDVFPGKNEDLMVDMWSPLMLGMAVDERNRRKAQLDKARTGQLEGTDEGAGRLAGAPNEPGGAASTGAESADELVPA